MATLIFIIAVLSFLFLAAKIVLHLVAGKDIVILLLPEGRAVTLLP